MDTGAASAETVPAEGLRARKRAAVRSAIERAAIDLVLRDGYEHVTVDMICTASTVSPRTFFNYFGSKEGVFLGPAPAPAAATEAVAGTFLADTGTPVVLSLAAALLSALLECQPDPKLARERMKVVMGSAELLAKQNEWLAVSENQLADLVLARYAASSRRGPAPELAAEARMVVGLALGVVRVVLQESYSRDDDSSHDDDSDDGEWPGPAAMARSGELLRRIFEPPQT